eukprot:Em0020g444a
MLRDRLVCGIRVVRVQRRLLAEAGLTFAKAFGLVQTSELAEKNVQDLQHSEGTQPIERPWPGNCSRCGGKHKTSDCRSMTTQGTCSDDHSDEQSGKTPMDGEKTETYALYNLSSSKSRMPLVQLLMVNVLYALRDKVEQELERLQRDGVIEPLGDTVLMLQMLSDADSMVTASAVRKWTNTDPLLSMAMRVISHTFATHGLPDILVSDNGTAFTSAEFQFFAKANGFRHVRSAPYHPATNGLAERAVQTLKNVLKRMTDGRKEMITSQEQDVEDIGPLDPNMPPVPEKQPPTPPMSDFTTPASA